MKGIKDWRKGERNDGHMKIMGKDEGCKGTKGVKERRKDGKQ
jgi:hypothetical protein